MSNQMIRTQPSVMPSQHNFSKVPKAEIQRSQFDRSHAHKTTFDAGYLIPVLVDEIYPGDSLSCRMSAFARISTPLKPIMDNLYLDSFFFFVPYRLIWDNFQKFMGEQRNPGDSTSFLIPQIESPSGGDLPQSLSDYFGIPTAGQVKPGKTIMYNAWFHRAYNLIWNEFFRDQNLQNSLTVPTGDGPDLSTTYALKRRNKRHDYFTSLLPWPQKGAAVTLPLGDKARIATSAANNVDVSVWQTDGTPQFRKLSANTSFVTAKDDVGLEVNQLYADLAQAIAPSINSIRMAFQIQHLLERDARGGTRYIEINAAHFGVTSPDARLQRPEYLGGGSQEINFYPVAQTAATGSTGTPQGNLSATGTTVVNGHGFNKGFTEHGLILGLVNVRADLTYQQGLNRMFSRRTKYDMYWPALAHIGEQAVSSKELYCDGDSGDNDVVGYAERWAELRYKPSMITGKFRSTDPQTLDIWHASQKFNNRPVLDSAFIEENPPMDRLVAVPSEPKIIFDSYFKYIHARPLPVYGVPGLVDHF